MWGGNKNHLLYYSHLAKSILLKCLKVSWVKGVWKFQKHWWYKSGNKINFPLAGLSIEHMPQCVVREVQPPCSIWEEVYPAENWYVSLEVEPCIAWQVGSDLHTKCWVMISCIMDISKWDWCRGEVNSWWISFSISLTLQADYLAWYPSSALFFW